MTITHCIPAGAPWNSTQMSCPPVNTSTTVVYNPTGTAIGRIIYFPSSAAAANQISQNSQAPLLDWNTFLQDVLTAGWQVISVNEFGANLNNQTALGVSLALDISNDAGNGTRLLATYLHYWDHVNLWAQKTQGGVLPTIVAGFSMGAWVSLQIALNRTSQLIGYISRSCPTQWNNTASTASANVFPQLAGVNTAGVNVQTMTTPITVSSMSISGSGPYTVTLNCGASVATITAGQWVVIDNAINGSGGTNWSTMDGAGSGFGYWQVGTSSGTTIVLSSIASFVPAVPTGAGGTATVRTNTALNGLSIPGAVMFGQPSNFFDGGFINPNDLGSMGKNAGSNVTVYPEAAETHQWSTSDSTTLAGWVTTNFPTG